MLDRQTEKGFAMALAARRSGLPYAIAEVVEVEGSSYRHAGARMFIDASGCAHGAISGGCLETDVLERSQTVLATGSAVRVAYDMRTQDDEWWGIGSGCNGRVDVLIYQPSPEVLGVLVSSLEARRECLLATVIATEMENLPLGTQVSFMNDSIVGEPLLVGALSRIIPASEDNVLPVNVSIPVPTATDEAVSYVTVCIERLIPTPTLLIIGSGLDVKPLAGIALQAGLRVVIADHRLERLSPGAIPSADTVLSTTPEQIPPSWLSSRTWVVVMTHHFEWDGRWLGRLLASEVPYIGMLGPRKRLERLIGSLPSFGFDLGDRELWQTRVFSPVGFDLGGEGAGVIAVAIVAEVIAHLNGKIAAILSSKSGLLKDSVEQIVAES
ncbi:MAG: XdhC family protein [Bacilli bacterium]